MWHTLRCHGHQTFSFMFLLFTGRIVTFCSWLRMMQHWKSCTDSCFNVKTHSHMFCLEVASPKTKITHRCVLHQLCPAQTWDKVLYKDFASHWCEGVSQHQSNQDMHGSRSHCCVVESGQPVWKFVWSAQPGGCIWVNPSKYGYQQISFNLMVTNTILLQYYTKMGHIRYVDLGLQTHRIKCRVHDDFK